MTINDSALAELSDREVLARTHDAVLGERTATARLIALLMELDARRLYFGEGCSSLFTYCTHTLYLSEHAAYNRIETARSARRFPVILDLIESGAVTLTTVRRLAPHLTDVNHLDVLDRARHKSKREIEVLAATLTPLPDLPSTVRKLPTPATQRAPAIESLETPRPNTSTPVVTEPSLPPPTRPAKVKPLAPERYKIQFTVSRETYEKLRRAQALLRHALPSGDPSMIFERALTLLLADLERRRTGKAAQRRAARDVRLHSRRIPASVKRTVWERDKGRCAFNGARGRCTETGFLEYHHKVPFDSGGETTPSNLELRCRAHNQYEADLWFGAPQTPMMREARAPFDV